MKQLAVGGWTPLSTVDWPGVLASVIFTRGCPWRCPYCQNRHLQAAEGERLDFEKLLEQLARRVGFIEGVVFSGGEPTLQPGIIEAMESVRLLGLRCALHTGGAFPQVLERILELRLVDWIGLDIKAPFDLYHRVTGRPDSAGRARRSLELVASSGVEYELRTTVWPELLGPEELRRIVEELGPATARRLVLQGCQLSEGGAYSTAAGISALANRLALAAR
jgi:pyruvate formate lyase activating enzyme